MFAMKDVDARFRQRPFVPVRVVTSSGESYDITHPEMVLIGQRELVIGIGTPDHPRNHDRLARVSLLHISAMEDLPVNAPHASPSGNGTAE
jgi:hypothetical protein